MEWLALVVGVVVVLWVLKAKQDGRLVTLRQRGLYPPPGQGTDEHVARLAANGYKIDAIKLYREIHGVGLKDAKDAVEKMAPPKPGPRPTG
jgi:hypothetical protein